MTKPCRFHNYLQVEKDGVYSVEQERIIRETPFARLYESFHIWTWKCTECTYVKQKEEFHARWWRLKDG